MMQPGIEPRSPRPLGQLSYTKWSFKVPKRIIKNTQVRNIAEHLKVTDKISKLPESACKYRLKM